MIKTIYIFFLLTSVLLPQTEQQSPNNQNLITGLIIGAIISIISGIVVGYFLNRFNNRSQVQQYKRTLKDDQIDKEISELKNATSSIMKECYKLNDFTSNLLYAFNYDLPKVENHNIALDNFTLNMNAQLFNLKLLLGSNKTEIDFYYNVEKYYVQLIEFAHDVNKKINVQINIAQLEHITDKEIEKKKLEEKLVQLDKNARESANEVLILEPEIVLSLKSFIDKKEKEKSLSH